MPSLSSYTPPPPLFPYHPLHPHTSAVNRGVRVRDRKECGGVRGVRLMKVMVGAVGQRGTVYPQSPCERDSGVSVFGLARVSSIFHSLPHSLSRSLSQELLLIKPVCFGRHTVALSSSTLAHMSTRRRTCITDTRAHPALFVLAVTRCHLPEPLNASDQPNTPPCLHLPSVDTHPPSSIHTSNRAERVGFTPPTPP